MFLVVNNITDSIQDNIENDSNKLLYLFPYHPENNSIEEFFSPLKLQHSSHKKVLPKNASLSIVDDM